MQFYNKQSHELVLELKKERRQRDGPAKKLLRIQAAAAQMQAAGVKVTYNRLYEIGFGKRIVGRYFQDQKEEKRQKEEKKQGEKEEQKQQEK